MGGSSTTITKVRDCNCPNLNNRKECSNTDMDSHDFQRLDVSSQAVYFTVKATNNGGATKEVTCSIDTYDVTLPSGRLEADFATTSNRHVLHGSLVVYEDSALSFSNLAVGQGKGVYAVGISGWEPVNLMDRSGDSYNGQCLTGAW